MGKRKSFNNAGGFILLLLLLLMTVPGRATKMGFPGTPRSDGKVFVQASGRVKTPGVYGFGKPPLLSELVDRAGGLKRSGAMDIPRYRMPLKSGSRVRVKSSSKRVTFDFQRMSAFYRLTLGIPISINRSTALGLTAVPGIGPKTAAAIVSTRERSGGFTTLKDLQSVRGISASLYGKISPYLTL